MYIRTPTFSMIHPVQGTQYLYWYSAAEGDGFGWYGMAWYLPTNQAK